MLKHVSTNQKMLRKCSQLGPKSDTFSGVAPPGTPLVAQPALGHQNSPRAPRVLSMVEKRTKDETQEPQDCEKDA